MGIRFSLFAVPLAPLLTCTACATIGDSGMSARSGNVPETPNEVNASAPAGTISGGEEIDVRLRDSLSSETAQVEQHFETITVVDLLEDGRALLPAGSVVRGVVSRVDKAGRIDRNGSLTLVFDRLAADGQTHDVRASATKVFESGGIKDEGAKAGIGAGVGGVIGGVKGAIVGAAIGAGGVLAGTNGADVMLPAGSFVRVGMDSPVRLG